MGLDVDEARRDHEPAGIDDAPGAVARGIAAHRGDAVAGDRDIGRERDRRRCRR